MTLTGHERVLFKVRECLRLKGRANNISTELSYDEDGVATLIVAHVNSSWYCTHELRDSSQLATLDDEELHDEIAETVEDMLSDLADFLEG